MPYLAPNKQQWEMPLGPLGLAAMALTGGVAYTVGEFSFYGFEFLPYWPMIGGEMVGMTAFAAAFGTFAECIIWNGGAARGIPFVRSLRTVPGALAVGGILVALAIACWAAHPQYRCAFLNVPFLGLVAFAAITTLQDPILHALRQSGRPAAAFAALLVLEAGLMFGIGEGLSIDYYRKGLVHFQQEHRTEQSIAFGGADFHIDYVRQEIVLRLNGGSGGPTEIRRSLAGFVCKS